jgi:hypothetical protein
MIQTNCLSRSKSYLKLGTNLTFELMIQNMIGHETRMFGPSKSFLMTVARVKYIEISLVTRLSA